MIQGHAIPYKTEAESEFDFDDKVQDGNATVGSSTRLTTPTKTYV
jgi:hypothetical protein